MNIWEGDDFWMDVPTLEGYNTFEPRGGIRETGTACSLIIGHGELWLEII